MKKICLFAAILWVFAVGWGSAQSLSTVSGDQVTVSAGSLKGVKAGMQAYVIDTEEIGGKKETVKIAKIKITQVSERSAKGVIVSRSPGYTVRAGLGLSFIGGLKPPAGAAAAAGPKSERPLVEGRPPARPDPREVLDRRVAGSMARMTLTQRLAYGKQCEDEGKLDEADAVYRVLEREGRNPELYRDDQKRVREKLAARDADRLRAEAEQKELEELRAKLEENQILADKAREKGDLVQAVRYQERVCRVDKSAAAGEKLRELRFLIARERLGESFYPEDLEPLVREFPDKVGEMQALAARNAEERERRRAAERERAEREQREAEERRKREDPNAPPTGGPTGKTFQNALGMTFVELGPGSFTRGSHNGDGDEKPVHRVTISRGFYLQTTEVTQAQWQAVMGNNPSKYKKSGPDAPVEQVSWEDAQRFIAALNQRGEGTYRLPTEAEWEYACRAGTTGDRYGDLGSIAWYTDNSGGKTHPVGQKQPNAWGLYDMLGNVWEWCADWYGNYPSSFTIDPVGPSSGSNRVDRGGSWYNVASLCRSANRGGYSPVSRVYYLGFRLARGQ